MGAEIGYVVVEYNQVSGHPGLPTGADIYWDREDAEREREGLGEEAASIGRRDRYKVAVLVPVDEWE